MPHYWFRIPLATADHLKRAKAAGGRPAVKQAVSKDAEMKGKKLATLEFERNDSYCDAEIESSNELSREDCEWFRTRWDIRRSGHAPCQPDVRPRN